MTAAASMNDALPGLDLGHRQRHSAPAQEALVQTLLLELLHTLQATVRVPGVTNAIIAILAKWPQSLELKK